MHRSFNDFWETILLKQADDLRPSQVIQNDPRKTKVAVIVEPRSHHPLLEACVRNAMAALGQEWNLEIHTYDTEFVATLFPGSSITFVKTPMNYTRDQYSELMMSKAFWERIKEETICIFQTDVVFFRSIPDHFLQYDYAGANYFSPNHLSKKIGGIQGGFSLRKKAAMLDCIDRVTLQQVCKYLNAKPFEPIVEDVFFTIACDLLDKHVPSVRERIPLAIESNYYEYPCAMHGFNCNYFTYSECEVLVENSPLLQKYLT